MTALDQGSSTRVSGVRDTTMTTSEEDDDDDEEEEDSNLEDTPANELGHVEFRELSVDKATADKAKVEAKKINNRRRALHPVRHLLELIYEYGKVSIVALVASIACMVLAYGYSSMNWVIPNNGTVDYYNKKSVAVLTSTFFIFGLAIFTSIQFFSVYGAKRFMETKFYLWALGACVLYTAIPWGMFWLGDVLLLVVGFTGLSFVMGYIGKPYQTTQERRKNGFSFLFVELLVSASALVYGMFFLMMYSNFSNIGRIAWRLVIHPIYFEVCMMIPVRLLVTKQMEKRGVNILHTLGVVHAQAHISTLGRMMISTINQVDTTIWSVVLLNVGKLVFRSSVQVRDRMASKVLSKFIKHEHQESKKFVRAVSLYSEMIMENASIPASCFAMWCFYNAQAVFFFPYPDGEHGSWTLGDAALNAFIQIIIAVFFDILTLWINERYFSLPLERAWKKMREQWLQFFGFMIFGVAVMGLGGCVWMAARYPRFVQCHSLDVCSCNFASDCQAFIATRINGTLSL
eukprot:gene12502-14675_t